MHKCLLKLIILTTLPVHVIFCRCTPLSLQFAQDYHKVVHSFFVFILTSYGRDNVAKSINDLVFGGTFNYRLKYHYILFTEFANHKLLIIVVHIMSCCTCNSQLFFLLNFLFQEFLCTGQHSSNQLHQVSRKEGIQKLSFSELSEIL